MQSSRDGGSNHDNVSLIITYVRLDLGDIFQRYDSKADQV